MSAASKTPKRDVNGRYVAGSTGNPHGRPRKEAIGRTLDLLRILTAPVKLKIKGHAREVSLAEARLRQMTFKAMNGDIKAAIKCAGLAEKYGLLPPMTRRSTCPGGAVLTIPWEWEAQEFIEMYQKHGDPPWPGARDGLIPAERRTKFNPNGLTIV